MVAGKDATDEYEDVGHSDEARKMLDAGGDIKVIGTIEVRPHDRLAAGSPGKGRAARLAPLCDLGLVSVRRVSLLPASRGTFGRRQSVFSQTCPYAASNCTPHKFASRLKAYPSTKPVASQGRR